MGLPAEQLDPKYTYGDYRTWPEGERWELINGTVYNMSPAPLRVHQKILMALSNQFYNFFKGKTCEVYAAPFDVRLPRGDEADDTIDTVVQPDISVICDTSKLDRLGCKGAPDLIVEIGSPGSLVRDMREKLELYETHRVTEYWIVLPREQVVQCYILDEQGRYNYPDVYGPDQTVTTGLFPGLEIRLEDIFEPGEQNRETEQTEVKRL